MTKVIAGVRMLEVAQLTLVPAARALPITDERNTVMELIYRIAKIAISARSPPSNCA